MCLNFEPKNKQYMGVHDTNDSHERMSTDSTGVVGVVLLQAEACQEKFKFELDKSRWFWITDFISKFWFFPASFF